MRKNFRLLIISFLFGCNASEEANPNTLPARNLNIDTIIQPGIVMTKAGVLTNKISGPIAVKKNKEFEIIFPQGVFIEQFQVERILKTKILADSAVYFELNQTAHFYKDVIVINTLKCDTLKTDYLYISFKGDSLYSPHAIWISKNGDINTGSSMISNLDFSNYTVIKPRGTLMLSSDSL
jgi:LPS export ABC transporter protein LptC